MTLIANVNHRCKIADDRFADLHNDPHKLLESRRRDKDVRVRVAIIDTGIAKHPKINPKRVKECRSFIDSKRGDEDTCGHGTQVAHTVLEVAPNADIYVARVFEDTKLVDTQVVPAKEGEVASSKVVETASARVAEVEFPFRYTVKRVLSISLGYRLCGDKMASGHHFNVLRLREGG